MSKIPNLDFTFSANVLFHYAMARAGINEERLKRDFKKQYELDKIVSVKTLTDRKGYCVTTENYELSVSEYGKIQNIKHIGNAKKCRVKEKQARRDVKNQLKKAAATNANHARIEKKYGARKPKNTTINQPETADSAIISTIQAEAKVPRVYVKRRKDLEPH